MTQNPGSCYQDLGRASAVQSSDYRHITLTHVSCGPMTGNTSIISGPSTWAVIRQMFLLLRNLTLTRWIQVWKKLWDFCRLWRDPRKFHFINGPLPLAHLLLLIVWAMFFPREWWFCDTRVICQGKAASKRVNQQIDGNSEAQHARTGKTGCFNFLPCQILVFEI